jgi:hypothetical protein
LPAATFAKTEEASHENEVRQLSGVRVIIEVNDAGEVLVPAELVQASRIRACRQIAMEIRWC